MSSASHTNSDQSRHRASGSCWAGRCDATNWSALNIATMVICFMVYWPIGLFVLFWIISGRDVLDLPDAIRRLWSRITDSCHAQHGAGTRDTTNNVVFNEFQEAQYERVREIKDEIKARARRFREFRAKARRRADEEEFNQFMADAPLRKDR